MSAAAALSRLGARLDHVGLVVADLAEATAFLEAALGASVLFRLPYGAPDPSGVARLGVVGPLGFSLAMLAIGPARVELIEWAPHGSSPAAGFAAGSHLALEVRDVADALATLVTDARAEVVGKPVTFVEGPTPGLTNAFVRLGGLLVELVDRASGDVVSYKISSA